MYIEKKYTVKANLDLSSPTEPEEFGQFDTLEEAQACLASFEGGDYPDFTGISIYENTPSFDEDGEIWGFSSKPVQHLEV